MGNEVQSVGLSRDGARGPDMCAHAHPLLATQKFPRALQMAGVVVRVQHGHVIVRVRMRVGS